MRYIKDNEQAFKKNFTFPNTVFVLPWRMGFGIAFISSWWEEVESIQNRTVRKEH
jgi:hypothetical protein